MGGEEAIIKEGVGGVSEGDFFVMKVAVKRGAGDFYSSMLED